ncbi:MULTISPECIES: hypothetical protein [Bacillus]|uniref:hypothetical protein n=1 Tax=Bacillus TaxID=1386 RepID=UPI0030CFBCC8
MELIFAETIKRDQKLENTDIVKLSDDYYMVVKEIEGYIARNFKGWTGATGHHSTLESLLDSLYGLRWDPKIFSHKDYHLELKKSE